MKKNFKYYAGLLLMGAAMATTGCSDDEAAIIPSPISNLTAESTPGRIVLRWDTPADAEGTIRYIEVKYFDHDAKKDVMHTASIYADSIDIPRTLQKYGEYHFAVRTVSYTGDKSEELTISKLSEKALATYVKGQQKYEITAADLSTNAQESVEGPIANLLDGNTKTFFHTSWSSSVPAPHWMQIDLHQDISAFWFYYAPRENVNNKPTNFDLMGSTDGQDWFLIRNFTQAADGLPTSSTGTYTSPAVISPQPFNRLKMVVNETNNGSVFWTMSEFEMYNVMVHDPEAE